MSLAAACATDWGCTLRSHFYMEQDLPALDKTSQEIEAIFPVDWLPQRLNDSGARPPKEIMSVKRRVFHRRVPCTSRTGLVIAMVPDISNVFFAAIIRGILSVEAGIAATELLLSREANLSAIFCANDERALGAIKAVRKAG